MDQSVISDENYADLYGLLIGGSFLRRLLKDRRRGGFVPAPFVNYKNYNNSNLVTHSALDRVPIDRAERISMPCNMLLQQDLIKH